MRDALSECYRVLRPGRWLTMEFHNSKNAVWAAIQEALGSAGFVVADVRVLDKQKGTTKQLISANAVMKDLIISAYKPSDEIERLFKASHGTQPLVWGFVREHLSQVAMPIVQSEAMELVAERQAHLLYDRMLAFCVMRGCARLPCRPQTSMPGSTSHCRNVMECISCLTRYRHTIENGLAPNNWGS